MKSRSHRPPVSEPRHDDWVDGSWTVDCICGVNFDDGEEMVDCDECGVWVHTRCSRYVKSEKSFACDKCKNKNSVSGGGASSGVRNDSEEAEVAEFLVELPTKTMLDTPNPASVSSRRPFRLWTNISMEERVHVQGVPGGESGFFSGSKMSSIFGPQLWEATGYVPKKSNFQYTEFPWFDNGKSEGKREEEMDKNSEEISKQANNGAGVLLSLSKEEKKFPTKVVYPRVVKYPVEGTVPREILSPKQDKKFGGKNLDSSCPKAILLNPGKRKKEPITMLKCQNEKKKLRTLEKEGETEVQAVQDSKAASSDAKYSFSRDIGSEAASSNDLQSCKDGLSVHLSDGLGECTTNLASNEHFLDPTLRNNVSAHEISRTENIRHEMHLASKNFSKVSNDLELLTNLAESMTVKSEVPGDCGHAGGDVGGATGSVGIGPLDKEPLTGDLVIPKAEINEDNPEIDVAIIRPNKKLKGELVDDGIKHTRVEPLSLEAVNLNSNSMKVTTRCPVSCANGLFGGKVSDAPAMSSELNDSKLLDTSKSLIVDHPRTDKYDASPDNLYATKEEPIVSEFSLGTRKISFELEHASELGEELVKSNGTVRSHSTNLYDHKVVVALAKPPSTSGGMVKSFDNRVAANAKNLSVQSRHKELPEGNMGNRKQNVLADTVGHDGKCGKTGKFVKELSRSSSLSKTSDSTKFSHMSDSKRLSSDSKDFNIPSSSKVSSMPNATTVRFSGEGVSPQVEAAPNARNKDVALAEPGKGEKSCQTGTQPSLRGTVTSTASASSNVPAALSDEELALLLHQELNSSPRVPRVSRMRHAGSLPQLTCPSAASMLVKRTSSGGKDQNVTSRKKNKDLSGEGPCGDLVASREAKKMERKPSSLDDRRRDSGCSTYQLSKKEGDCGPVKSVQYVKKASGSSCLSSDANGHNALASCPPARNTSEDDPRMVGCQEHHTLPGLIAEIMSEGKRMTYEDLCNAVLPHWPHLRKHNGERYAYSSHSQAVLDCLRNRSEWARLVDRGPKTSASRKGRKLDSDSLSIESEENEDSITKNAKDVVSRSFESHQEDFPKGKRKARKRRRLALQGRGIVRRRRADIVSDEDSESFSNSVGDSMSSEEEIQGDGTSAVGSDASTSSDDGRR